jgi:hypothetical protein
MNINAYSRFIFIVVIYERDFNFASGDVSELLFDLNMALIHSSDLNLWRKYLARPSIRLVQKYLKLGDTYKNVLIWYIRLISIALRLVNFLSSLNANMQIKLTQTEMVLMMVLQMMIRMVSILMMVLVMVLIMVLLMMVLQMMIQLMMVLQMMVLMMVLQMMMALLMLMEVPFDCDYVFVKWYIESLPLVFSIFQIKF